MMRVAVSLLGILASVVWAEQPLDLRKSATYAAGTYTLSGTTEIKRGTRIKFAKGARVVGSGKDVIIELSGSILLDGAPGAEVVFENVSIYVNEKFQKLQIKHAKFEGGDGVSTYRQKYTRGKVHFENVEMTGDAGIWLRFDEGGAVLRHVRTHGGVLISAKESTKNAKVVIENCQILDDADPTVTGGGMRLGPVKEAKIVNTKFGGLNVTFRNCDKLDIDGCQFDTRGFYIHLKKAGVLAKYKIANSDFTNRFLPAGGIHVMTPKGGKDKLTIRNCYYIEDEKAGPEDIARIWCKSKHARIVIKGVRQEPNRRADLKSDSSK